MALEGFTEDQKNELLDGIFVGTISLFALPTGLYAAIGDTLFKSVITGFGATLAQLEEQLIKLGLLSDFQRNTFAFSAAKTFQQVKDMSAQVFKGGQKLPFNEFKKRADQVFGLYNTTWLNVEQRTAVNQAFAGQQWVGIQEQKEDLPLLQFQTVGDDRVRASHIELDNKVKPVDDIFWDSFMPPLDWNCRCIVQQLAEGDAEISQEKKSSFEKPNKLFNMNPGKDRLIFREDHPYFKVADRFEVFKGQNFGLNLP